MIGAVYDRDYFCDEQIAEVLRSLDASLRVGCVLERKEIENYLLAPFALDRAIVRLLGVRRFGAEVAAVDCAALLNEITGPMKQDVLSQLMARRHDYLGPKGQDKSRLYKDVLATFEGRWAALESRMALIPGKEVLGILRERVQQTYGVTLTEARIAEAMTRNDIPADMCSLLNALETFRTTSE